MMALAALVVLCVNLEVSLRMEADGTDVGGFSADDDVAAVAALPDANACLAEHLGCLDVAQQGTVALLVVLLDGCHATELFSQLVEAFLVGFAGKAVVHVGPLVVLALGSVQQVLGGGAYATQVLEPQLGVLLLVLGSLQEEGGNLLIAVLLGHGGVVGVLVAGHRLTGKGCLEVFLGAGASVFPGDGIAWHFDSDLHKVGGGVLADGTGEVVGQFLAHVLVAADAAAPDGLALCCLTHGLGFRLDVLLIIIIGGRRHVGEYFHLGDGAYEEHVRAQVDGLFHVGRDEGVGTTRDGQRAVGDAATVGEAFELIDCPSALETEVLEHLEVGSLADNRGGELAGMLNEFGREVTLVQGY